MKLDPKDGVETGWKGGGVREHDDWKDNIFFLSLSLSPLLFFFLLVVCFADEGND
jgi:hypothetical protein